MIRYFLIASVVICALPKAQSQGRGGNPKYDATYNPYEKIIKDTIAGKRTARFIINFIQPEVLRDNFTTSPCNEFAELSNTRIAQFNECIEQFVAGKIDNKQMSKAQADFEKKGSSALNADLDYHIGFIEKQGTFSNDANTPVEHLICRAKGSVQAIKSIVSYAEAIKKLFPAIPGIDEVIQKGKKAIATYPDNKSILTVIKKNKQ